MGWTCLCGHHLQAALPGTQPAPPPDLGGEVLEVKGHRAGQVPEAEARCTSGAQRAAMLERRRRRRGASWVPAAAPVGCSRGSNGAAKWRPVRPRAAGRRDGVADPPGSSFSPGLAETPHPHPGPHPGAVRMPSGDRCPPSNTWPSP